MKIDYVVTGASSGIGRKVCESLISKGYNVLGVSRGSSTLISSNYSHVSYDLSCPDAVAELSALLRSKSKLLGLVNNAAQFRRLNFNLTTRKELYSDFEVNMVAPFELTKAVSDNNPGINIVNISSYAGLRGKSKFDPLFSYGVSKAALVALTEYSAVALRESGGRANCIAPGAVQTDMLSKAFPELWKAAASPDDLASLVSFLLSEDSHPISGKVFEFENGLGEDM
ncbi:MAG: hypothetical protein CSH37_13040 [Thalassolituus sp.]|nr:MAG: hypothetical protein CSH37_13040 [Thalassolituus sp.]